MKIGNLSLRVRGTVVGCGSQGEHCLALAVSGRAGNWRVRWGLYGTYDDPTFEKRLRARVWRRPFWVSPVGGGAEQDMAVCRIDLSFSEGTNRKVRPREFQAALRTQVTGRLVQSAGPLIIRGIDMRDRRGGGRHIVGAAASEELIEFSYRMWRRQLGVINPHIGSDAAALANLYLALYCPQRRAAQPWRLLVLVGRETTHVLLMNEWRLVDAIAYQMMEDQVLTDVLLESWVNFFVELHSLDVPVVPCIIESAQGDAEMVTCERWNPFDNEAVAMDAAVRKLVAAHPDLAGLAFGMALQGG